MDSPDEIPRGDEGLGGFRMTLPENCVEYMLFLVDEGIPESHRLQNLEAIRKAAMKTVEELTKDYIWQREPFSLETKIENGQAYLHGITDYGDNVEDEWLIVYLLRELSKTFSNIWIRVFDSDGEFLLIEAAKVLPSWLNPEMDSNRVWIHDGKLFIIPLSSETSISKSISLPEALETIKSSPNSLVHSTFIEAEAFYRLEKYPGQIKDSLHHAMVTIPRKLAYILHARPKAIAPATEAFYLRDPLALKPLMSPSPSNLIFPPTDLVTVSVRFTKVLYAQLKSQRFEPPPTAWKPLLQAAGAGAAISSTENEGPMPQKLARLDMGMKITSGFEMLCRDAHKSKSRITREVALLLDDLEEDGEAASLPTEEEIRQWEDASREDDDSWMDIDFADFEKELNGGGGSQPGFGDAAAQADLQKIVSRFEAFLNDEQAGIDGAQLDEMDEDDDDDDHDMDEYSSEDDEDREVSFDEEQFSRMMREMMGLPSSTSNDGNNKLITGGGTTVSSRQHNAAAGEDEDEEKEIQSLMLQMEKELNEAGALALDPPTSTSSKVSDNKLLANKKNSKAKGKHKEAFDDEEEGEEAEDGDQMVDIDYNLAKNLLESFKSQAGMAGPTGNLLGLMGMNLPRDEDDYEEAGGSK